MRTVRYGTPGRTVVLHSGRRRTTTLKHWTAGVLTAVLTALFNVLSRRGLSSRGLTVGEPKHETPGVFASRLGIRAGHSNTEWVTWGQVLEWSVAAYWTRRPKQGKRGAA